MRLFKTTLALSLVLILGAGCAKQSDEGGSSDLPSTKVDGPQGLEAYDQDVFFAYTPVLDTFSSSQAIKTLSHIPKTHGRVAVKVNAISTQNYQINRYNELILGFTPPASSKVEISYDPDSLYGVLQTRLLYLPEDTDLPSLIVLFNGVKVELEDLRMSRDESGSLLLNPSIVAVTINDDYHVMESNGLRVQVFGRSRVVGGDDE